MSEFIHFEAEVSEDDSSENENDNDNEMNSFINDASESENEESHSHFANFNRNIDEVNRQIEEEALQRIHDCDDYSNLSYASDDDESSIFEFDTSENHIKKFKESLLPKHIDETSNSFVNVILLKIREITEGKSDNCCQEDLLKNDKIKQIFEKFSYKKTDFSLDLQEFNNVCYKINEILTEFGFFLRVFEQKNKYRQLLIKKPEKQNQVKQLASCLIQKYNGFQVIKSVFNKRQRRTFSPVDIIYIPTKNAQILPLCFYTTNIANAYTALFSEGMKTRRAFTIYECYYCNKFFRAKSKVENHLKVCSGKPGVVSNFCSRTITSFEDNYKLKGDVPFAIYFDFETTAPTDSDYLNPEEKKMFVMSYVIVVAFHPHFNFERVIVQRSMCHPKKEMLSVNYLSREQFQFKPPELAKQLYDQALFVLEKSSKNALATMFGIELAFVKKTLLSWFNKKVAAPFKRLDEKRISEYEKRENFSWDQERKCVICKMSLRPSFSSPNTPNDKMYYGDYIIRYEYKFLKNIFSQEQLETSSQLKSIEAYYKAFEEYIHFAIQIYRLLNNYNTRLRDLSADVREFLETNFSDCDVDFIKEEILETDTKNALKTAGKSVPTINLKIYAYLYNELFCFLIDGEFDCLISDKFFIHVHNQIKQKLHLHHSHITGEIYGYAHDFCNKKVIEMENPEIPCIAHNLFGFDYWFFLKGFSTTAWTSKELSAGGNNLTNLNYSSIRGEIKFIDSLKYYQRSLAELTSSMDKIEIEKAKITMKLFLEKHYYFSSVWPFISATTQEKILQITCEGKGIIPYEIVKDMNSFFLKPENDFWEMTEFYSELKQKHVTEEEYNDSKFLYKSIKMRHLGDLNDLFVQCARCCFAWQIN